METLDYFVLCLVMILDAACFFWSEYTHMCVGHRMGSSKLALLLVLLSCVERSLSASCVVDSFTVKEDFDPKRVSDMKHTNKYACRQKKVQKTLYLLDFHAFYHSTQVNGTHCRRKIQRACSYRTTSQLSTPLMMTAPWLPPPRDVSLCLGKSEGQWGALHGW